MHQAGSDADFDPAEVISCFHDGTDALRVIALNLMLATGTIETSSRRWKPSTASESACVPAANGEMPDKESSRAARTGRRYRVGR